MLSLRGWLVEDSVGGTRVMARLQRALRWVESFRGNLTGSEEPGSWGKRYRLLQPG